MSKKATGISNAHYAVFNTTNNAFDAPKPIKGLETLSITETYAEGSNYADNLRNIYIKELVGADLSLEFSNITRAIEAELTGQSHATGELEYKTTAVAPQVAILFEKNYSDGSKDRIVYYNCKLTKDNENGETKTDSFNFIGDSLSGQAIPMTGKIKTKSASGAEVDLTDVLKFVMDSSTLPQTSSDNGEVNKKFNEFFTKVQFKAKKPTE